MTMAVPVSAFAVYHIAGPISALERKRAQRERAKNGVKQYAVELENVYVESLIDQGYLSEADSRDRRLVALAIASCVKDTLLRGR